jgi:hypothetical protein
VRLPYHESSHNILVYLLEITHHHLNYGLKSATTAKMRQNYVCKGSLLYLITKKVLIFSGKSGNNFGRS